MYNGYELMNTMDLILIRGRSVRGQGEARPDLPEHTNRSLLLFSSELDVENTRPGQDNGENIFVESTATVLIIRWKAGSASEGSQDFDFTVGRLWPSRDVSS